MNDVANCDQSITATSWNCSPPCRDNRPFVVIGSFVRLAGRGVFAENESILFRLRGRRERCQDVGLLDQQIERQVHL
jgi:hypothetical protein